MWPAVRCAVNATSPTDTCRHRAAPGGRERSGTSALIAKRKVTTSAAFDQLGIAGHHGHLPATGLLQRRETANVVEMRLRRQQPFDVGDCESELGDRGEELRGRRCHAAVDEDVAVLTRNRGTRRARSVPT